MDLTAQLRRTLGDGYTLERELGGGGMSRVFVAEEHALGRKVVVKVLSPELAATLSAERFTREIKLAAALQEPHIVPVLTAGLTADGLPYYTMPFVSGESVRARLGRGPLPVTEALGILRNVAQGLAYAHDRGIVHRDIKPENVLLSSGTAVVTDFGIAKALSASATHTPGSTLTSAGSSIGTPAYMAPEQAVGDAQTDHRADIYAWGVLAWELLAGAHPFADAKSASALVRAHIAQAPAPLAGRAPGLAASVSALVMQCLEKSPDARPQAMSVVLGTLADGGVVVTPVERSAAPAIAQRSSRRGPMLIAGGVAAALIAALVVVPRVRAPAGDAATINIATLAVLPFINVGGDAKDEYFSDGITDELAHALSQLPGLRLAGRSSSFAFKGKNVGAKDIGRQLDVAALIEGTVRRAGDRLRITVQLTSSADGKALWQDSYENNTGDVFQIQDNVTKAIVAAVSPTLRGTSATTTVIASRGTSDTAAYDLYLQGRFFWARRGAASLARAADLFRAAIAKDPKFARAYAGLGLVYAVLPSWNDATPWDSANAQAQRSARSAIALDPTLADPYVVLTSVGRMQARLPESLAFADSAIRLEPGNATAHQWKGLTLAAQGEIALARAALRQAKTLDPLSNTIANNELQVLMSAGEFAAARDAAARILDRDSTHYFSRANLSTLQVLTGSPDSGLATAQVAARMNRSVSGVLGRQLFAYAALGRWSDADALRARLAHRSDSLVSGLDGIFAAMAYGDHATAVDLLARGFKTQGMNPSWFASPSCDPVLAPLRTVPAYVALMKQYGLKICTTPVKWPIKPRAAGPRGD